MMKTDRLKEARAAYEEIVAGGDKVDRPLLIEARYYLGMIARLESKWNEAVEQFTAVVETSEKGGKYLDQAAYYVGLSLHDKGDFKAAGERLSRFIRDFPKSDRVADAWYDLAWCCMKTEDKAGERSAWERLLAATDDPARKAQAHFGIGSLDYAQERFGKAEESFAKAAEASAPGELSIIDKALYMLALSRLKGGKNAPAVEAFMKLVEKAPASAYAPVALSEAGRVLLDTGKPAEAEEVLQRALKDYPTDKNAEETLFRLAESQRAQGKWGGAVKSYQQFLKDYPKSAQARAAQVGLGECSGNLGAYADAIAAFEAALAADKVDALSAKAQFGVGEGLFSQKKYDEAKEAYYKVVVLYPIGGWNEAARFKLGVSAEAAGKTDEAVRYYQDFLTRHPKNVYVNEAKERLAKLTSGEKP
jgi:TolA-binding protein